jgi:dihydrofolate synthase/folylpolyglutamate synthase
LTKPLTYPEAVKELEQLGIMPTSMPQIAPMQRALAKTGLLGRMDASRNVIIAGTNGKGSTAATLSALLHSAGQRVGLYTSPHLVTTRERIRIGPHDVSEDHFARAYVALKNVIEEEKLTHFEALTLIAAWILHSGEIIKPVDWAVWEVGLGGLYDATNAIPHHFCAITQLGLDHQAILGNSLPEVAAQKFGVIGKDAVVVHSPMDPCLEPLRKQTAARTGCRWISAKEGRSLDLARVQTPWGPAKLSLLGARAAENTALALTLFEAMGFSPEKHLSSLSEVRWPGRFSRAELPGFACPVYLSGDHNAAGIESLLEILSQLKWVKLHLVVGIGKDKDGEEMLTRLMTLPNALLYLTETAFKPLALANYPARFRKQAVLCNADVSQVLQDIRRKAAPGDLVLVTGSLYLVGQILANPI